MLATLLLALVPSAVAQPHAPFGREKAPERIFRDFHPIPVSNGMPSRMISNDWEFRGVTIGDCPVIPMWSSVVRGIGGENGSREWSLDLGVWHKVPGPNCDIYWAPIRLGWPFPYYGVTPIDNVQVTADLGTDEGEERDGVADFLSYGWERPYLCDGGAICYDGRLDLRDGLTGEVMWEEPVTIAGRRQILNSIYRLTDFPTGLYAFDSPAGARFVWKTTDITYDYRTGIWLIQEEISLHATMTGRPIWTTQLLPNATTSPTISTYITGAAQLDPGSEEYEVVWDAWSRPPVRDGRPPKVLEVGALQGAPELEEIAPGVPGIDRVYWGPSRCYVPPQTGNDPKQALTEEDRETALFHYVRLIDDVQGHSGDPHSDIDEVVCTHLSIALPNSRPASANGRFLLHAQVVNGATGSLFWPKTDVKQQGYGFVGDLNEPPAYRYESWGSIPTGDEPDQSNGYLAMGTVDLRQPQVRGARFPPKEVRLTTLRMQDGSPISGTYSAPFAQDSHIVEDWALKQYATALAGRDYTGDGIRELISPAKYNPPSDKVQELLSTVRFDVNIIDGKRGQILRTIEPWGPHGMVLPCPGAERYDLTTLSGHARRIDVTRTDALTGERQWREPWYLNPRAQAQTAGIDFGYIAPRCADTPDDRTLVGYSAGLFSMRRGFEVAPVYGAQNLNGTLHWLQPELAYRPPLNGTLEGFLEIRVPPPTLKEQVGMSVLSVAGGISAAFGSMALFNRRRGSAS